MNTDSPSRALGRMQPSHCRCNLINLFQSWCSSPQQYAEETDPDTKYRCDEDLQTPFQNDTLQYPGC